MKTIISTAIVTFSLIAGASTGKAESVLVTPFKGAPYATQVDAAPQAATTQAAAKQTLKYIKVARKARGQDSFASAK